MVVFGRSAYFICDFLNHISNVTSLHNRGHRITTYSFPS